MGRVISFRKAKTQSLCAPVHAGDIVSVVTGADKFGVMKILAVDDNGVHARLYVQRFAERPLLANINELTVAAFDPNNENILSLCHLPLTHDHFALWEPDVITSQPVTDDELGAYYKWLNTSGCYF